MIRDKQTLIRIYQETLESWNKRADEFNQWNVLYWEEKSNRLLHHVSKEEVKFIAACWEDIEADIKLNDEFVKVASVGANTEEVTAAARAFAEILRGENWEPHVDHQALDYKKAVK